MVTILCAALVNAWLVKMAGSNVLVLAKIIVWKDVVVVMTARVRNVGAEIDSVNVETRAVKQMMNVVMMALVY